MSLRIVYSHDFTIQPKFRKKKGITLDERLRNIRRLKKFDRVQAQAEVDEAPLFTEAESTGPEHIGKTDTSEHDTQRAHASTSSGATAAGSSVDRPPSYSESNNEPDHAPPTYVAGPSNGTRIA